jgi:hypothetical protein
MWVQTCFPSHFLVVGYTNRSTVCYICYNNVTIMLQYNTNTLHCINDIMIYFLYIHICKYIYTYIHTHACINPGTFQSPRQRTLGRTSSLKIMGWVSAREGMDLGRMWPFCLDMGKTSENHGELLPKMEVLMEKRSINRRCSSVCHVC